MRQISIFTLLFFSIVFDFDFLRFSLSDYFRLRHFERLALFFLRLRFSRLSMPAIYAAFHFRHFISLIDMFSAIFFAFLLMFHYFIFIFIFAASLYVIDIFISMLDDADISIDYFCRFISSISSLIIDFFLLFFR